MSAPDLEPVPTCAELAQQGLARAVEATKTGKATKYVISAEGQQLIYDAQRRNAVKGKAWDAAHPSPLTLLRQAEQAARDRASDWARDAFAE